MPETYQDFITNYLARITDLDNPLPLDSEIFLPEREVKDQQGPGYKVEGDVKVSMPLSQEEKERLREEYCECVAGPPTHRLDSFPDHTITEVLDGKGWVVPHLLSPEECEELIQLGEDWGIGDEDFRSASERALRVRTSSRTNNYCNEELTIRVNRRLSEELLQGIEASTPYTSVRGIHPNWRVARYQEGQTFPAHQDQADSVIVQHKERVRQRFTSSHTLIINLRQPGRDFQGGATRFFMEGNYSGRTVDLILPQGWGLVFQQRGMLHAGLAVQGPGTKGGLLSLPQYIAQAGVLRGEPEPGVLTGPASVFKHGPGIKRY